jgi:hypothetical protein
MGAIRTIIIADAVMSLDNVIAVAAAAKGDLTLVVFGILVSIPIVVWGSKFVLKLMDRLPIVITFGGALLGWIAGDMLLGDAVVKPYLEGQPGWLKYVSAAAGALLVVAVGTWLARRAAPPKPLSKWRLPLMRPIKERSRMPKLLVPVDGSTNSDRVIDHLMARSRPRGRWKCICSMSRFRSIPATPACSFPPRMSKPTTARRGCRP